MVFVPMEGVDGSPAVQYRSAERRPRFDHLRLGAPRTRILGQVLQSGLFFLTASPVLDLPAIKPAALENIRSKPMTPRRCPARAHPAAHSAMVGNRQHPGIAAPTSKWEERHENRHRGAGQVGATAAYSMMMRRVGSGILLVDRNADLAVAQARDILDGYAFFADPARVRAGEFADLDGARLVVLAAGTQPRGQGEPAGSAVAQRRNLLRDCAGSVGGRAGPDFSSGDQSG